MRRLIVLIQILLIASGCCNSQHKPALKSTSHGLNMMLGDVDKDILLEEMRFEHGHDSIIDVVRLDHIGRSLAPLIISEMLPVETDSLGILGVKLQNDSLEQFMKMIHGVNPKVYSRNKNGVLIRVTYRYKRQTFQYYVTEPLIGSEFLKMIERRLISNNDKYALNTFYHFATRTGLVRGGVVGDPIWKY